jgi:cytosine/uracil/thiamine/allantoin permease
MNRIPFEEYLVMLAVLLSLIFTVILIIDIYFLNRDLKVDVAYFYKTHNTSEPEYLNL